MKQLKPCPFCLTEGAKLIELWNLFDAGIVAHIHCEHCGADGPSIYIEGSSVDAALARARSMWNGRDPQSETARLVDKSNAYIIDNARLSDALDEMRDAHIKERESLRMMLSDALSALEYHQEQTRPIHSTKVAIDMIRRGIT